MNKKTQLIGIGKTGLLGVSDWVALEASSPLNIGGKCVLRKRSLPLVEVGSSSSGSLYSVVGGGGQSRPIRRSLRYRGGAARGRN